MPLTLTNLPRFRLSRLHLLWLGLFVLCTALQLADLVPALRYDRRLVSDHHWWLLFTGQLVHTDWPHWLLNMTGVAIVGFFFSAYGRIRDWLLVLLLSSLCVSLGVHFFNPEVIRFVGLSGVLHGLFIYGALREIGRYPLSGYVLLGVLVAKLAYEFFIGVMPYTEQMTAGKVITESHLYGAIGGVVAYLVIWLGRRL